ncbi:MAG: AmmeMemoRadiSam system radical SAM enzyme [Candidatus Micrarchaeota archaeon]|nr:AmmeMemoRadiSam system radical SAM enzyme [Candidatus Micrarchaeota archaeon]
MIVQDPLVDVKEDGTMQCKACARRCIIRSGEAGFCGIRKNVGGKLDLIVYGRPAAFGIDPVEKKPQFHFLPGTGAYSLGTYGCTFMCKFCCNWELAQAIREHLPMDGWMDLPPEEAVAGAKAHNCDSLAYTYNEPVIWFEYHRDIGNIAMREGLFNILVTDGYGTPEFWKEASKYIHATSIDLKGFNRKFYADYTGARLDPVLDSIKEAKKYNNIWVEVTSLVVPGKTDSKDEIRQEAEWLAAIDPEMPLHLIAFHPNYKMLDVPAATGQQVLSLRDVAMGAGLKYVYAGNVRSPAESTYCPKCGALLVERQWFSSRITAEFDTARSKCRRCGQRIPGVWAKEQAQALKNNKD